MINEHKKGGVPVLRFPEFWEAGEWEEKPLNKISTSIFDGTHQTPTYTEEGIPFFSVENIVSGKLNKFISREDYLISTSKNKPEKGDILITRIGNIGFSAIVDWEYEFSIYVTLAVVKKTDQCDSYYLHCFFQSERYQTEIRSKSLLNAVPCKINMDELRKTKILLPSLKEQQKIAACLSSLDELITAQAQKVEALKTHKKGLMQQLFPAEGETVPKLRFPEFREAREWDICQLSKLTTRISDGIHTTPIYDDTGECFFINGNNLGNGEILIDEKTKKVNLEEFNKHKKPLDSNSILMSINGTIGNIAFFKDEKVILGKSACFININSGLVNKFFIYYLLQTNNVKSFFNSELTGSTIRNLSLTTIKNVELQIPELAEQQKIAACLSSLDELITAQAQKLNTLKTHKKGLMQQLFPNSPTENTP